MPKKSLSMREVNTGYNGIMTIGAEKINKSIKDEYENQNRILSFEEFLDQVRSDPARYLRSSAQYLADMMDSFGRDGKRFKLFNQDFSDPRFRLIGQEQAQESIYQILKSFIREGVKNKLILLHGPNGSEIGRAHV